MKYFMVSRSLPNTVVSVHLETGLDLVSRAYLIENCKTLSASSKQSDCEGCGDWENKLPVATNTC